MVSASIITVLSLFSLILAICFILFTIFMFKAIIQLKQKTNIKSPIRSVELVKPIYERMGDDPEATEQYVYMRRKLTGG
jgi:hypothetical protein